MNPQDKTDVGGLVQASHGHHTDRKRQRCKEEESTRLDRHGPLNPFAGVSQTNIQDKTDVLVSNGHHTKRKRQRGKDKEGTWPGRRGALDPFAGVSQTNLNAPRRSNGKRQSNGLVVRSPEEEALVQKIMAHKTFPREPVEESQRGAPNLSGSFAPSTSNTSISHQSLGAALNVSQKIDKLMSGEETLPLSDLLADAYEPPETPELKASFATIPGKRSPSPSSPDPINMISSVPRALGGNEVEVISVEDDSNDEGTADSAPNRSTLTETPRYLGIVREGYVRDTAARFDPKHSTQPTLANFLEPVEKSQLPDVPRPRPSAKVTKIDPGFTRGGPVSDTGSSANPKPPAGRVTVVSLMGGKKVPTSSSSKSKTSGSSPANTSLPAASRPRVQSDKLPAEITLPVEEWYCGSKRHITKGHISHSLTLSASTLVLGRKGEPLTLLKGDIEHFQVQESCDDDSVPELVPAIILVLRGGRIPGPQWQKFAVTTDDTMILVRFDPQPEGFDACWRQFIHAMTKWAKRYNLKIDAMRTIIKQISEQSYPTHSPKPVAESMLVRPPARGEEAVINSPVLTVELDDRGPSTPTKRRTRSMGSKPTNEVEEPKPIPIEDPDKVMLVYPQAGAGAVTINKAELARLEPGEFLNDTLIELGLKMWLNSLRQLDPALADEIHIFSSFFFKKLDGGKGKACEYDKVKKWTAKFDLFSKKFIIVPINEHLHWYLAIICFPEHVLKAPSPRVLTQPGRVTRSSEAAAAAKVEEPRVSSEGDTPRTDSDFTMEAEAGSPTEPGQVEVDKELADQSHKMDIDTAPRETPSDAMIVRNRSYNHESEPMILDMTNDDSEGRPPPQPSGDSKSQKTWILILDSLGGKHQRTVRLLREYLQSEAQERHKAVVELKDTKTSGGFVDDRHLAAPVQPNWCDCGVYLLHYVEIFYANALEILALPPGAKSKKHPDFPKYELLWKTEQVKRKREAFRDQVLALSSAWLKSRESMANDDTEQEGATIPLLPPLSNANESLVLIEMIDSATVSGSAPYSPRSQRTGRLSSPAPALSPVSSEAAVESMTGAAPEVVEYATPSRSTRRGTKGGSKHGARPSSEGTQSSLDL